MLDSLNEQRHHPDIGCSRSVARMIVRRFGMKRREFLGLSVGGAVAALSSRAAAQASIKEIRIGYQKSGVLVIARQQAVLEKRFAGRQIGIKWIEFTSGPPLLEAMSTGSVDLGAVGDTPPIFAQAANANIVYVAGSPITNGQGILVPANSSIRTIAENMPGYTANTLMRTLQLTSYRDATAASQNANISIIDQVIRIAALDDRTCLSCITLPCRAIQDKQVRSSKAAIRIT